MQDSNLNSIEEMFSSGTSNEDVFTMQLRSMMHGEDNDKVRQTVAWTDIPRTSSIKRVKLQIRLERRALHTITHLSVRPQ